MPLATIDDGVSSSDRNVDQGDKNSVAGRGGSNRHIFIHGLVAGGIYGGFECLLMYPSIFLKTQLQLEYGRNFYGYKFAKLVLQSMGADRVLLKYDGPMDCIRKTYQCSGIRGFYTGCLVSVIGSIPKGAIKSGTTEAVCGCLEHDSYGNLSLRQRLLAGGVAAVIESILISAPLDTISTHLIHSTHYEKANMSGPINAYRSIVSKLGDKISFAHIYPIIFRKYSGFADLYRGTASTVVRQVSMQMIRLVVFEMCRNAYLAGGTSGALPLWVTACSGGLAGVISVSCVAPVDLVKTRMQGLFGSRYNSYLECIRNVWQDEGFRAFYRGSGPHMVRSCMDMAFVYLVHDYIMNHLKNALVE